MVRACRWKMIKENFGNSYLLMKCCNVRFMMSIIVAFTKADYIANFYYHSELQFSGLELFVVNFGNEQANYFAELFS